MKLIAAKMIEVMKECSHVLKNGTNNFHAYKYATCADVLEKVNASFVKHGISTMAIPELLSMEKVTTTKGNTENLASVKITIMLIDSESGETMSIVGLGSGQDSGDKAIMKAQTAAIKYAYLLSFAISTGDDPENDTLRNYLDQKDYNSPSLRDSNYASSHTSYSGDRYLCENCGSEINRKVKDFSNNKYGKNLCIKCQQLIKRSA
mgnify:FL=1